MTTLADITAPTRETGLRMPLDWSAVREQFPALAKWTHLNTATFGLLPQRATEAVAGHWTHRDEFACADFLDWFKDADRLRSAIGRLIHATADDIAFVGNSSGALGMVVRGMEWQQGDNIVTLAGEFPHFQYLVALVERAGVGFMYVAPRLRAKLPPNAVGWRSHRTWREVDELHHGRPVLTDTAERYEGGGLPSPLLYAMEASIDLMFEIGPDVIERRVLNLAAGARTRLRRLGAETEDNGSHIVGAKLPGVDSSRLARELESRRGVVGGPGGIFASFSPFFNDE